ncbi:MAG TPA: hypothetical protein PKC28_00030, partial [Bdellovibrionales bacterium]|nr:hypothetical protein [Bdellovibrionales bacterium]
MDKFLANAPKSTLAFIAVVGGILLIVFSQPPASICDSQIEVIKKSQDAFLYKDPKYPKAKTLKTTRYEYLRDHCKTTNSPGGCYELFQEMKVLLQDLNTLPEECAAAAGSEMQFKRALNEVM